MKAIRPHHLFCMSLFTGHGYSQAFADNMAAIIEDLKKGDPFCLTSGQDDICRACPHRQEDGGCAQGTADVQRRDTAALEALGLQAGSECCRWSIAAGLGKIDEAAFQRVCGGCRWAKEGLCSWTLLQEQVPVRWVN